MLSFTPERIDYLPGYAWSSALLEDVDYYTIFLTTEPEVALKDSRFRLIPIIMTNENRDMLKKLLEDCRNANRAAHMLKMETIMRKKTVSRLATIESLLPKENPEKITTYALNRNTLCVICTSETVQTGMDIIVLDTPFSYDSREIDTIYVLQFNEQRTDIIEFFHTAADVLQKQF